MVKLTSWPCVWDRSGLSCVSANSCDLDNVHRFFLFQLTVRLCSWSGRRASRCCCPVRCSAQTPRPLARTWSAPGCDPARCCSSTQRASSSWPAMATRAAPASAETRAATSLTSPSPSWGSETPTATAASLWWRTRPPSTTTCREPQTSSCWSQPVSFHF